MVCSKCQKKLQKTELATPGVKRKNDMYYGSATSISGAGNVGGRSGDKSRSSATLGNTGIGKVRTFASTCFSSISKLGHFILVVYHDYRRDVHYIHFPYT